MKRLRAQVPKRPQTATAKVARTPQEAAIRLVRLEFDAARLQLGIDTAQERMASYHKELAQNTAQRRYLLEILNG